jgi:transcriptional regulator with XRE-family HTH domain
MLTALSERLRGLLDETDMSFAKLAEKAEIPLETVRNIYYGRVKDPKVSTVLALAKALDVSVNYLFGGITENEIELVTNFRKCGMHGKSRLLLLANYEAKLSQQEKKDANKHSVPCIVPVGEVYDGLPFHCGETVDLLVSEPRAFLAFELNTNNFAPVYCKGDKVLLEKRFPKTGERALFMKDCTLYCRTFIEDADGYTLKCLNRLGKDFKLKRMDEVECLGTCIGIVRGN